MINSFRGEYRWLSNFWLCTIYLDGYSYPSTEHAYQAAKTDNPVDRDRIRKAPTCKEAKHLGYLVKLRSDWESIKLSVMEDLLRQKFTDYPDLKQKLLATGDQELIEGNTWNDTYWGVCNSKGENHLGKLLMKIRAELR